MPRTLISLALSLFLLVEATGFEPTTSASRTQRSTKLSHASSTARNIICVFVGFVNKKKYIFSVFSIFLFFSNGKGHAILKKVTEINAKGEKIMDVHSISTHCTRTEFVGTAVLDTIGLVISGIDDTLLEQMNIGKKYHTLGLFSSRTGAAGQLTAIDDAVKATNTEVLSIELPRDTKGWGGHGNYIVLGGADVSDVRHAVSLALELTNKYAGELYISESGHLEFAFSASAGQALQKAFGAVPGEAFGFMAGSPAAIGLVMADTAVKASGVKIIRYMTPDVGTSHSNEVILALSGDASAVKTAVISARQIGLELLIGMGSYPEIPGTPYL